MADHDDYREHFELLKASTVGAHYTVRALLAILPVPVEVALLIDGNDTIEAITSMADALDLIEDEPMSDGLKAHYRAMILDWFTAYELCAVTKLGGPTFWRLSCIDAALMRIAINSKAIAEGHAGEL